MKHAEKTLTRTAAALLIALMIWLIPAAALADNWSAVIMDKKLRFYKDSALTDYAGSLSRGEVVVVKDVIGTVAEVSYKGVRIKNYYSLNPSDKFNSGFLAKDAIRIRGGEMLCCKKELSAGEVVFSALDNVEYTGFPVYSEVSTLTSMLQKQHDRNIYIPFLPPESKPADFSFLLKEGCLTGVDKTRWQEDSLVNYATKMNIYFDDEMKLKMWNKLRLVIHTHYNLWSEVLQRYARMTGKNIILPLADARFLECVTDGGGNDYIYKGNIFLPEVKFVKNILLNELGEGERPVFSFMDERRTKEFINDTDDVKALLYILSLDYWTLRYHVETDFVADK